MGNFSAQFWDRFFDILTHLDGGGDIWLMCVALLWIECIFEHKAPIRFS